MNGYSLRYSDEIIVYKLKEGIQNNFSPEFPRLREELETTWKDDQNDHAGTDLKKSIPVKKVKRDQDCEISHLVLNTRSESVITFGYKKRMELVRF